MTFCEGLEAMTTPPYEKNRLKRVAENHRVIKALNMHRLSQDLHECTSPKSKPSLMSGTGRGRGRGKGLIATRQHISSSETNPTPTPTSSAHLEPNPTPLISPQLKKTPTSTTFTHHQTNPTHTPSAHPQTNLTPLVSPQLKKNTYTNHIYSSPNYATYISIITKNKSICPIRSSPY